MEASGGEAWVKVSVLLRRLAEQGIRLTDETIRNYAVRDGMPHLAPEEGQARLYRPSEVLEWIRAHKPAATRAPGESGNGGKRAGAGRKRHQAADVGPEPAAVVSRAEQMIADAHAVQDSPESQDSHADWLANALRPVKLTADGKPDPESGMTKAEAERQQAVIEAARKQAELDERLGRLLDRDEVVEAWAEVLNAFRLHLEGAAAEIQAALVARLGLDPARGQAVRAECDTYFRRVLERLADDPLRTARLSTHAAA